MTIERPTDPTTGLQQIEETAGEARQQIETERSNALRAAESEAQADAVNERFNALQGEVDTKIADAIEALGARLDGRLGEFGQRIESLAGQNVGGDDILSIEEIADDAAGAVEGIAEAASDTAAAVADNAATLADEAPQRLHALFRPLWGGGKR